MKRHSAQEPLKSYGEKEGGGEPAFSFSVARSVLFQAAKSI
jgi:hypothetical protein